MTKSTPTATPGKTVATKAAATKTAAAVPPAKAAPAKAGPPATKKAVNKKAAVTKAVAKTESAVQNAPSAKATAPAKVKTKLVRDSFTIPKQEYAVLDALKLRAAKLTRPTKKSELIRAGIAALAAMSDKAFLAAIGNVPSLKTGRPKIAE